MPSWSATRRELSSTGKVGEGVCSATNHDGSRVAPAQPAILGKMLRWESMGCSGGGVGYYRLSGSMAVKTKRGKAGRREAIVCYYIVNFRDATIGRFGSRRAATVQLVYWICLPTWNLLNFSSKSTHTSVPRWLDGAQVSCILITIQWTRPEPLLYACVCHGVPEAAQVTGRGGKYMRHDSANPTLGGHHVVIPTLSSTSLSRTEVLGLRIVLSEQPCSHVCSILTDHNMLQRRAYKDSENTRRTSLRGDL